MSRDIEHQHQVALFNWAAVYIGKYPELAMMYAIPNGGHRHPVVAMKLKAEGVKRGVPDICLPVARDKWHALYIELKKPGGKPTAEQEQWIRMLIFHGCKAKVCRGWTEAAQYIADYLGMEGVKL